MPQSRINLQLYDIDGCIFTLNYCEKYRTLLESLGGSKLEKNKQYRLIAECNAEFLNTVAEQIKKEGFSKVIVASGSSRQDAIVDNQNAINRGSCVLSFPCIKNELENYGLRDITVITDNFWMADLYHNREGGTNYYCQYNRRYGHWGYPGRAGVIDVCPFDHSKITLIYTQVHRTRQLNLEGELVVDFYEDRADIRNCVINFFNEYPSYLPRSTTLRVHKKDNSPFKWQPMAIVKSTERSANDPHPHQFVVFFESQHSFLYGKDINHIDSLEPYYENLQKISEVRSFGERLLKETISPKVLANWENINHQLPGSSQNSTVTKNSTEALRVRDRAWVVGLALVLVVSFGLSFTTLSSTVSIASIIVAAIFLSLGSLYYLCRRPLTRQPLNYMMTFDNQPVSAGQANIKMQSSQASQVLLSSDSSSVEPFCFTTPQS